MKEKVKIKRIFKKAEEAFSEPGKGGDSVLVYFSKKGKDTQSFCVKGDAGKLSVFLVGALQGIASKMPLLIEDLRQYVQADEDLSKFYGALAKRVEKGEVN